MNSWLLVITLLGGMTLLGVGHADGQQAASQPAKAPAKGPAAATQFSGTSIVDSGGGGHAVGTRPANPATARPVGSFDAGMGVTQTLAPLPNTNFQPPDVQGGPLSLPNLGVPGTPIGLEGMGLAGPDLTTPKAQATPATTQTAVEADATQPAGAAANEPDDPLWKRASEKFRDAEYRECADILKAAAQKKEAGVDAVQLYVAALVATNQLTTAAFQAEQGARLFPKTFFLRTALAALYKDQPDFRAHFEAVHKASNNATMLQPGILWAMYQQIEGSPENNPAATLALIRVKTADLEWYHTLRESLNKKPVK